LSPLVGYMTDSAGLNVFPPFPLFESHPSSVMDVQIRDVNSQYENGKLFRRKITA
jgi:hypothetical protein